MTLIQWTDQTWNPVTGCTRVSPGCAHCYIERTPPFRIGGRRFEMVDGASTTGVRLHADRLEQPLHWRKPRRVFVCSLADLFHDDVPDYFIRDVLGVIACAPQHTFQILTKRPERARALLGDHNAPVLCARQAASRGLALGQHFQTWPLPNVWMGVSIENVRYTWRADVLREIPAAVRFISAEPLLGSLFDSDRPDQWGKKERRPLRLDGIDWVIVGGESGPGARPFYLEHAREILLAREARVWRSPPAIFVKQLGAHPVDGRRHRSDDPRAGSWEWTLPLELRDRKGGDPDEWPADLRVREFPLVVATA